MESVRESLSISTLNGLLRQRRNADFKSIVSSADRSKLIKMGGNTLIHTATATSNLTIISFLIVTGFDINAQNARGQTPLFIALFNRKFHVVQLLLSFDPDILIADGEGISCFQLCFQERSQAPEYVKVIFLERLKGSGLSAQKIVDELDKAGCTVHQALAVNDAEVIGLMLDRIESTDKDKLHVLFERAMNSSYTDSVRALVTRGPGSNERLDIFLNRVKKNEHEPSMRFYFQQLVNWDLITEDFAKETERVFKVSTERDIQMYLDIGIDEYVRKKFGLELLVSLLGNYVVNCIKIFESRQFDVNGRDSSGFSMLHKACMNSKKATLIYLLEKGADPNIKNYLGRTPLFYCYMDGSADLLLEAGADVQVVTDEGKTILHHIYRDSIVAELCILEARGLLRRELVDAVENYTSFSLRPMFHAYRSDIEWMKTRNISGSVTLFTVLAERVEKMARHVKNEVRADAILQLSRDRELQPTYASKLKRNLEKAVKMHELRHRAAVFFSNVMEIVQIEHLVIEKITSYLTYPDSLVFDRINVEE